MPNAFAGHLKQLDRYPPLSPAEEKALTLAVKRGDLRARERMILCNMRLAVSVAREVRTQSSVQWEWTVQWEWMDFVQEANAFLIKAVDKFDPKKGFKFSTYATWVIRRNLLKSQIRGGHFVKIRESNYAKKTMRLMAEHDSEEGPEKERTFDQGCLYSLLRPISLDDDYGGVDEDMATKTLLREAALEQALDGLHDWEHEVIDVIRDGESMASVTRRLGITKKQWWQLKGYVFGKIKAQLGEWGVTHA